MSESWAEPLWSTAAQWSLLPPVLLALLLTTAIGLEREAGAKSAGLRTHVLVGVGAAVFMVISKYGFADLLATRGRDDARARRNRDAIETQSRRNRHERAR